MACFKNRYTLFKINKMAMKATMSNVMRYVGKIVIEVKDNTKVFNVLEKIILKDAFCEYGNTQYLIFLSVVCLYVFLERI